jgi:hypothetical protein
MQNAGTVRDEGVEEANFEKDINLYSVSTIMLKDYNRLVTFQSCVIHNEGSTCTSTEIG